MRELEPEARHILELARAARTPNETDKARVDGKLALMLGMSLSAASAPRAADSALNSASLSKLGATAVLKTWIGVSVIAAISAAGYLALSSPAGRTARFAPPPMAASVSAAPRVVPEPVVANDTPEHAARSTLQPSAATPNDTQVPARPPALQPAASRSGARGARMNTLKHDTVPPSPLTSRKQAGTDDASLSDELDLLHRAQATWRAGDAASAMSMLAQHRARYPGSSLALERDTLQVLALCELGRKSEASRLARAVLARVPHSPLRTSLEQSCALQ